jgi:glycosyltransferase involved in cell wall biosynthesis
MTVCDVNKIKVFTHWVDTKRFTPKNHHNNIVKVLFVGRPISEKGYDIIKQVEKKLKDMRFIYAQDVPNENMPSYFQMADVLVVPSLYDESPNRVVAEGAACGCVVVTSNKGALPEQVKDFGFSIEPTVSEFTKTLSNLAHDRQWLSMLRQDTIEYAEKYLTEKNALKITREY